jgi:uncharacterized protein (DUF2141 family)
LDPSAAEAITVRKAKLAVLSFAACAVAVQTYTAAADPEAQSDAGATRPVASVPAASASASAKPVTRLTVRADALRNDRGIVFVALFDSEQGFDAKKPVRGGQARPANRSATVVFENVPVGKYAVSFIHDENENKTLDTNFLGIPTEGFGFSRNAMGAFGPPGFDDAAVNLPRVTSTVVMRAKYLL